MHVVSGSIDSAYVREWADLLVRWLHVVAGIAWIGASFYFILLDNHLQAPAKAEAAEAGVMGELWEVHGGGFYHVQKYRVAPHVLPERLACLKWEAGPTWLSGFALLCVVYFSNARAYLIHRSVADLTVPEAIAISVALLVAAWLVYDVLCRALGRRPKLLALALFGFIALSAYVAGTALLASRDVHRGRLDDRDDDGRQRLLRDHPGPLGADPRQARGARARSGGGVKGKLRSVHNNYLTLPVVLTMLSNHFPFVYGHDHAWLVLCAFVALGACCATSSTCGTRGARAGRSGRGRRGRDRAGDLAVAARRSPRPRARRASRPESRSSSTLPCGSCHMLRDAHATGVIGANLDAAKPSRALVINRVTTARASCRRSRASSRSSRSSRSPTTSRVSPASRAAG